MKSFPQKLRIFAFELALAAAVVAPMLANAAAPTTLGGVVALFIDLLETAIPIIATLALVVFLWGLVKFIYSAGDAKAHEAGRALIFWGIIGLFIMVSIWAILTFLAGNFGFTPGLRTLPEAAG